MQEFNEVRLFASLRFVVLGPQLRVFLLNCNCLSYGLRLPVIRDCDLTLQNDLNREHMLASLSSVLEVRATTRGRFGVRIDCVFVCA